MTPTPDPLHYGMRVATRVCLERLARLDLWDQDPLLAVVAHGDLVDADALPPELRDVALDAAMPLVFAPLPVPPQLWSVTGDLAGALDVLAKTFQVMSLDVLGMLGLPDSARMMGMVLVSEAWGVDPRSASEPIDGSLAEHPDRVELRLALGVDRTGEIFSASQTRGSTEITEETGEGRQVSGAVPDALTALLDAIADDVSAEFAEEEGR